MWQVFLEEYFISSEKGLTVEIKPDPSPYRQAVCKIVNSFSYLLTRGKRNTYCCSKFGKANHHHFTHPGDKYLISRRKNFLRAYIYMREILLFGRPSHGRVNHWRQGLIYY